MTTLAEHEVKTTNIHGILDTSDLRNHLSTDAAVGTVYKSKGFWAVPNMAAKGCNTLSSVANRLMYCPFFVRDEITISDVRVGVSTGSGTIRMGIVKVDETDFQPHATGLKWQNSIASSSAGWKSFTGLAVVLEPGTYFSLLAVNYSTMINYTAGSSFGKCLNDTDSATMQVACLYTNSVGTGALSDPVPDWVTPLYQANAPVAHQFMHFKWD